MGTLPTGWQYPPKVRTTFAPLVPAVPSLILMLRNPFRHVRHGVAFNHVSTA